MSIRDILEQLKRGEIDEARAEQLLKLDFLERIGEHTCFDHAREARRGIPEIVFGETKTPAMVADIVERVMEDRDADPGIQSIEVPRRCRQEGHRPEDGPLHRTFSDDSCGQAEEPDHER